MQRALLFIIRKKPRAPLCCCDRLLLRPPFLREGFQLVKIGGRKAVPLKPLENTKQERAGQVFHARRRGEKNQKLLLAI